MNIREGEREGEGRGRGEGDDMVWWEEDEGYALRNGVAYVRNLMYVIPHLTPAGVPRAEGLVPNPGVGGSTENAVTKPTCSRPL